MNISIRTSLAVLAVALILFAIVILGGFRLGGGQVAMREVPIKVLRAQSDLEPYNAVNKADIFYTDTITVPETTIDQYLRVPPASLVDTAHPMIITRYLHAGEVVQATDVLPPEKVRFVPNWDLEIISFPADFDKVVGGQLWPGQRINIYLYGRPNRVQDEQGATVAEAPQVELIAHHALVVDVRTASGTDTGYTGLQPGRQTTTPNAPASTGSLFGLTGGGSSSGSGATAPASVITVAVPHLVALRLVELGGSLGFRVWVSLSPREDTIVTVTPSPTRQPGASVKPALPTAPPVAAVSSPAPPSTSAASRSATLLPPAPTSTLRPGQTPQPTSKPSEAASPKPGGLCLYYLVGTEAYLVGGYGDNLDYDASRSYARSYDGVSNIYVDACQDEGTIRASLEIIKEQESPLKLANGVALRGHIELQFDALTNAKPYQYGGIASQIEVPSFQLAGDPGLELPYLPKTQVVLAAWGRGQIKVDGKVAYSDLNAFVMYTRRGVRDEQTRRVLKRDGSCCYHFSRPDDGYTKDGDSELHFWFYSDEADANNLPPRQVFVNVVYENVKEMAIPSVGGPLPKTGDGPLSSLGSHYHCA
jgi:hypothetical protein